LSQAGTVSADGTDMGSDGSRRILVVDDDPAICRIMSDLLMLDGHLVHLATSTGDAIELVRMRYFDLIFLDFYLPEMTGDKLLAIIKRNHPRQRVVLMSGQKPFPRQGQADFIIKKPFTADMLRDCITKFAP
jgi:DNA-binding NtrC family response regulator